MITDVNIHLMRPSIMILCITILRDYPVGVRVTWRYITYIKHKLYMNCTGIALHSFRDQTLIYSNICIIITTCMIPPISWKIKPGFDFNMSRISQLYHCVITRSIFHFSIPYTLCVVCMCVSLSEEGTIISERVLLQCNISKLTPYIRGKRVC